MSCCCSDDHDKRKPSKTSNVAKKNSVIQAQPLPDVRGTSKSETVLYWEGFRPSDAPVRPTTLKIEVPNPIKRIDGTEHEILFLLENGSLWSFDRTSGQELTSTQILKPTQFPLSVEIETTACGRYHSLALDANGNVYSWGSNHFGQLGHGLTAEECETLKCPQLVKSVASKVVIQIAAGDNHSLILTENGELFTCGSNLMRQLSFPEILTHTSMFMVITSLNGLPWGYIAAGGNQSFALTINNTIYFWGDQSMKQSGLRYEPEQQIPKTLGPTEVTEFYTSGICYISTGLFHTLLIPNRDSVLVSGSNYYNQMGPAFNEGIVTQASAGDYHSLVVGNGNLYCYGLQENETGIDFDNQNQPPPAPVTLPFRHFNSFAFGKASFIVPVPESRQINIRHNYGGRRQVLRLDKACIAPLLQIQGVDSYVDAGLQRRFRDLIQPTIWNASFKKYPGTTTDLAKIIPVAEDDPHYFGYNIDFQAAEKFIQILWSIQSRQIHSILVSNLETWLDLIRPEGTFYEETSTTYALIPFLILHSPKTQPPANVFLDALLRLLNGGLRPTYEPLEERKYLVKFANFMLREECSRKVSYLMYRGYTCDQLERIVAIYKKLIVNILLEYRDNGASTDAAMEAIHAPLLLLELFSDENETYKRISHHCFSIPQLNGLIDLNVQFTLWMQQKTLAIVLPSSNLCEFPFVFDASAKAILLQCEQKLQMFGASILSRIMEPPELQGFGLLVHRNNLLEDVLRQISLFNPFDFKKPLRIQFVGEEGQDAGGVRKEFFLLLIPELLQFCEEKNLLKPDSESQFLWFNEASGDDVKFLRIFGVLAGLAIYNNTIIKLPFPSAVYKKLLEKPCELEDLIELSPTVGKSLQQIKDYALPDLEQVFNLTFEADIGGSATELKPGGKGIPLSLENKTEFVELYLDTVFNKSVETSFANFQNGFNLVFDESYAIEFFRPDELQEIIIGNEDYDWGQLEEGCDYKGAFHRGHETIQYFWEVFHELGTELKQQFLLFLTGSDRVPISGMSGIQIIIQSVSLDESYFPVAHTCFNLLDLPVYTSKQTLKEKLLIAIEHKEGFFIA